MANPAVVVPIPDKVVTKGQVVSDSLTGNLVDADAVDRLVFSVSGLPVGTGISIDADTGILWTAAATAADVAALPITATVTAELASNGNVIGSVDQEIDAVGEQPSAGTTFYVSSTATGTGDGSQSAPWRVSQLNLLNPSALSPTPSTHIDIRWVPGNYDNQPYIPLYGGLDASTIRIRNRLDSAGTVTFRGPQTGSSIDYGIELRFGGSYAAHNIEFMRETGKVFEIDGQVVMGSGAGECGKGEAPENFARIRKGILVQTSGCILDLDVRRTAGWNGLDITSFAALNATDVYRVNWTQHGTPFYPGASGTDDSGDMVWLSENNGSTQRHLFDADATASRSWTSGGHGGPQFYGGTGAFRCQTLNGDWSSFPTFSAGDGQRAGPITSRTATGWHIYNCVINRGGQPSDTTFCELMKLEGSNNTISDSVLRNADHDAFNIASGQWSWHARGVRISHCVIENLAGTIADIRDYLDDLDGNGQSLGGSTRISDIQIKNCIVRNIASATRSGWEDEIIHVVGSTGVNHLNVLQMHGVTIEDATRDADTMYINTSRGTNTLGKVSITDAMATQPNNFSNITVTTNCGLDDAPAAGTDIDATEIADYYTLNPADTTSLAQGVDLTLANGAGVSSTALVVDDARWFDDPQDGAPPFGQQSEGFFVHVNGANRQYTAINYSTNTITLAVAASWSDNAPVNKKITSGSTPNRGVIR